MKTICAAIIVKNESHVIARALFSLRGIIDYWVICDTGSTDGTQAVILESLFDIPGELHSVEWVNFGYNRGQVLSLAKEKADYSLIIDADMVANVSSGFKHNLTADMYDIRYQGNLDYSQVMLVSNKHEWYYCGSTHEYIQSDTAVSLGTLDSLTLTHFGDGGMRGNKFTRDIELLKNELLSDPKNPRVIFYLAQSYKDSGDYGTALDWYQQRIKLDHGWSEETWYALYQIGVLQKLLNYDPAVVLRSFLKAVSFRPQRLEAVYEIVKYYSSVGNSALGYLYGHCILSAIYPDDRLFIDKSVYQYKLLTEFGICAVESGRFSDALKAFADLLKTKDLPGKIHYQALKNRDFCYEEIFLVEKSTVKKKNKIKVLVLFHNPGHFLDNCIDSLIRQDFDNFEVICIDDCSGDNSADRIPADDDRFTIIRNTARKGLGYNFHTAHMDYCDPDDIVVHLDGDDWLAREDALSLINDFYNQHGCWVMYGQFQYSGGRMGMSAPYISESEFADLRTDWRASHIRTFRAGLYKAIGVQDPDYLCMKDSNGNWFNAANDAAIMFPVMELAGFSKVRFNSAILYIYNESNPNSVFRTRREAEENNFVFIQKMRPFMKTTNYYVTDPELIF